NSSMRYPTLLAWCGLTLPALAATEPAKPKPSTTDAILEQGKALFDAYAPEDVKQQWEFPDRKQWDTFTTKLQRALDSNRLDELASFAPEARTALSVLRELPGYEGYTDWLAERLDYAEAAKQATQQPPPKPAVNQPAVPYYDLWVKRLQSRPVPSRAAELVPELQGVFADEGLPPELVWLAEAESTFNPDAESPVGARGLFQLMPATAKELGLSTAMPDERTDPEKSARAAARYLRQLHGRFGDWALALAAYNAGPGRIRRTLNENQAKTFAAIAETLPAETRMYVPKVLATLAVRSGNPQLALAAPR
ncbi:MAG TPA: lytic transglycosylase domain-containing protein, partial [Candidatus Didemnitutus sp.]|nr:lytic transglycosylase domain-containing protein [Candidatus Didemnitutus sp.]